MAFLRARQRTITALSPHQANPTYLIPSRPVAHFEANRTLLQFGGDTIITVASLSLDSSKLNTISYSARVDDLGANRGIWRVQGVVDYTRWRSFAVVVRRGGVEITLGTVVPVPDVTYLDIQEVIDPAGTITYSLEPAQIEVGAVGATGVTTGLDIGIGSSNFFLGVIADFKIFDNLGSLQNHWPIDDDVIDGGTIVDIAGGQDGILTLGAGNWFTAPPG